MRETRRTIAVAASTVALLAACAAPNTPGQGSGGDYTPLIDMAGVDIGRYSSDLAGCRQMAYQIHNPATVLASGLLGAAIGAALAPRNTYWQRDYANAGAVGGIVGAAGGQEARAKQVMINCMVGKGYRAMEVSLPYGYGQNAPQQLAQAPAPTPAAPAVQVAPAMAPPPPPAAAPALPAPARAAQRIGPDSKLVESLPDVQRCNAQPVAQLVGEVLASLSNYSVACSGGDTLLVRCEYGTCRVLK